MKVVCVGAGPAGLYFAILTKLRDPKSEVVVLERNPAGVTFGWGVTFSDDVLDALYASDPVSAKEIQRNPASWGNQIVALGDQPTAHLGGYGFAIGRHRLLEILAERATALGVEIRYDHPVDGSAGLAEFADADVLLAADGVNSQLRDEQPGFGTHVEHGGNYYLWLGAARAFGEFTYAFERTEAGWISFSAYPFDANTTTFIPECSPETWRGLDFDTLTPDQTLRTLEKIFAKHLRGASLLIQSKPEDAERPAPWSQFKWIVNDTWFHGRTVLAGDAAHTAHFSIGNGTKLAFDDVIELDRQLAAHPGDLDAALRDYQEHRRDAVEQRQRIARTCAGWFENVHRYTDLAPVEFAYALRHSWSPEPPKAAGVPWLLHRATQLPAGRWARGQLSSAKRRQRVRETRNGR
jgi:2-polyprenyl-6-methoxyphenol hydroxylase-like FAD-dependent oxidoreductase